MVFNKLQKEYITKRRIKLKKDLKEASKYTDDYHQGYLHSFNETVRSLRDLG